MKISKILESEKRRISFEVFPPKAESSFESVKAATEQIAKLSPSFMSVTYGANGGASSYTLDIAKSIKVRHSVPSVAHLTCVNSTKESIRKKIDEIKEAGIENVMALRGDMPEGADSAILHFKHATDLIYELKSADPNFCIGAACYPEVHPESKNQKEDIKWLKEKVDAGCDFLTTQMFFDNNLFYAFLYRIREAGITVPVLPGIMPITSANQIERALKLSKSFMPRRFLTLVDKFADNPEAMKQAGIIYATDQIIDLYASDIKNVHVYSMNNVFVAEKITENLSAILDN